MAMRLEKREKVFVSLGVGFVMIFLLAHFIVFPFFDRRETLKRGIAAKRSGLKEISALSAQYATYTQEAKGLERHLGRRKKGFTLFSFLEQAAGRAGVKDHIKYMKPSDAQASGRLKESMVEMRLDRINLRQLVDYLYLIESPEYLVSIKRASIRESQGDPAYLDAVMQVVTVVD
jgi:general secretion pathway protein M